MTPASVLAPTGHTVYSGRATSWPGLAGCAAASGLLLFVGWSGDLAMDVMVIMLVLAGVVLEVLTASSLRVTAGPNGLTVHWGALGWPRATYALADIARVEVVDLPWWRVSYGFWWTLTRTSCTLRRGPAVQLTLVSGRIVTVTVPDPTSAARALQAAAARSRSGV